MTDQPMTLMDFVKAAKAAITEVDGARLETMRSESPNLMLLDVREADEYEKEHLEGAMLVPRGTLEAACDFKYPKRVQRLVDARERPLVLYCATGGRSAMAAATLKLMGFKEVYSLAGGIVQWEADKRSVTRGTQNV